MQRDVGEKTGVESGRSKDFGKVTLSINNPWRKKMEERS